MQTAAACTWSADGLPTPLARTLMDSDPGRGMGRLRASGYGRVSGLCLSGLLVAGGVWLVVVDTPTYRFVVRQSRSEEHTSELQSQSNLVCRLLLEKKKKNTHTVHERS